MADDVLQVLFPGLRGSLYQVTSPRSNSYNCIAWAAGEDSRWWDPSRLTSYWPPSVPREASEATIVEAFSQLGYHRCEGSDLEPGFEKVAIYGDDNGVTHLARQLADGRWTSKLGKLEDIEHASLQALEGPRYGRVFSVLRRPTAGT